MSIIRKLNGHSGCNIELRENSRGKYVRKTSGSTKYNDRLEKQMLKQKGFCPSSNTIKTPKIYDCGINNGLFYFDMEYINGISLNKYMSFNSKKDIDFIILEIFSFIQNNGERKHVNIVDEMEKKILNISSLAQGIDEKYINYCLKYDWSMVESGFCHGDLTFENVLIYKGKIYLIDFLDSFVNTNIIDYSKLLQDMLIMWSWRNQRKKPFIKNIFLYEQLKSFVGKEKFELIKRMLILNLLRIFPYAKNKDTKFFLENSLNHLSGKFYIS
jgi:serine/threonine protein kinase